MSHETTSHTSDFDVVIVGARAAGAATAMLLARAGLRVMAVERTAEGTDTLSTHALMRAGVLQLHRWGLLDRVIDAGTPAIRTSTYTYDDARRPIAIKAAFGVDALYAPRRTVLDQLLVDAARDAGAEVRHQTRVTGLVRAGGRVAGVHLATPTGSSEVRAALVVGADGIRSTVAERVGAVVRQRAHGWSGITYGYWSAVAATGYEWVFHPGGCSGAIPTNSGQVCVFAAAPPERIGRGGIDVIRSIVRVGDPTLADRLDAGAAPAVTRTWSGAPGFFRAAHGPGWALVGDAGYFKDPITAHGLTDALRDAELLSRAIVAGLGRGVGTLDAALAGYEAERDELSRPLAELSERIASYDWDVADIDHLVRSISSATVAEVEHLAGLDRTMIGGRR